ncbi:MAG: autoinducer binding domain-containing protein [Pseudomonadota bacterium]
MLLNQNHREFVDRLNGAAAFDQKVELARLFCTDHGFQHFVYVFASYPDDIVNRTAMTQMTFPDEVTDLYAEGGGVQRDPVALRVNQIVAPEVMDNTEFARDERFADHPLTDYFLGHGWALGVTYPFKSTGGLGAFTAFADNTSRKGQTGIVERGLTGDMIGLAEIFHAALVGSGAAQHMYSITEKERDALAFIADGDTVSDLSERLKIGTRAVEKRLARARRKLGARSTANAVYRAAVRGII